MIPTTVYYRALDIREPRTRGDDPNVIGRFAHLDP